MKPEKIDNDRYCGDCINVVSTPIGSYCEITGENLFHECAFSHDKNDTELLRQCNSGYETKPTTTG